MTQTMFRDKTRVSILSTAAVCSALTQAALFGIVITLALVDLSIDRWRASVLATATFNGILVLALLAIIAKVLIDPETNRFEFALFILSSALSLCALTLSLYLLVRIWISYHFKLAELNKSVTASLVLAGLVLCSVTILSQLMTYLLLMTTPQQADDTPETTSISPVHFSGNLKSITVPSPSRTHLAPYSPSLASLQSLKSSRQGSFNHMLSPIASKTRLLISHPLNALDSVTQLARREPSLEIACRGEVTEMIDTSQPYELSSSPPLRMNLSRTRLETIPGSRPVSPAKPLQPYLFEEVKPEDFPLPDSPTLSRATSPVPIGAHSYDSLPFPPMIGEVASQTHIHPLFRSDSPGPPPSATPGTKVVASPYAGQIVGPDHVLARKLKSAQNIRPPTPARSPVPSLERCEVVPNFSRPGGGPSSIRKTDMF